MAGYYKPKLHEALKRVAQDALAQFKEQDGRPFPNILTDFAGWTRQYQDYFTMATKVLWQRPPGRGMRGVLEVLDSMRILQNTIKEDPELDIRLDNLVGCVFRYGRRDLYFVVEFNLLRPLIGEHQSYEFDDASFDNLYATIEHELFRKTYECVALTPIIGVEIPVPIELSAGLMFRRMDDEEIGVCISANAIPMELGSSAAQMLVLPRCQCAVVHEIAVPVEYGQPDLERSIPQFADTAEAADRVVMALRLLGGGSVSATRPVSFVRRTPLDLGFGHSFGRRPYSTVDLENPCTLSTDQCTLLAPLVDNLESPRIMNDGGMQVALRRLVSAGCRSLSEDSLIDLMIAAESIFGADTEISFQIALRAAVLLKNETTITVTPSAIQKFFRSAYSLRSILVHGSEPARRKEFRNGFPKLDGSRVHVVAPIVEELETLMRHAMQMIIRDRMSDSARELDDWPARISELLDTGHNQITPSSHAP